jgi:hypothetical protein
MGRFNIGTIGFGRSQVKGRNLVPEPPAISTARINPPNYSLGCIEIRYKNWFFFI